MEIEFSLYKHSKIGFTKGCIEKAEEMGNVALVSYADILASFEVSKEEKA